MTYELIKNSGVGVIIDPTPIYRDIKDTYSVSFVLPFAGVYIALFRDESGVEYRTTIKDGAAKTPKQLLTKNQLVGLTVCYVEGDSIRHVWECHTLKVGTFLSLRQAQWQITVGMDDKAIFKRIADLEHSHAQTRAELAETKTAFCALQADYSRHAAQTNDTVNSLRAELSALSAALASVKTAHETLASAHNQAIEVINGLSRRVSLLEKHYDPTLI